MRQVVIENPIINSPFSEPERHFKFDDAGITSEVVEKRRFSSYFIPIPRAKNRGTDAAQQTFEGWTEDRIEENKFVNAIRLSVERWREGRYTADTSRVTARLLEYWKDPSRSRRLFYCQIEALETLIYLAEVARKYGDHSIENDLRRFNEDANPGLFRLASKMATGSGKTWPSRAAARAVKATRNRGMRRRISPDPTARHSACGSSLRRPSCSRMSSCLSIDEARHTHPSTHPPRIPTPFWRGVRDARPG